MIGLAAANAVIQFGVIVVALRKVADQQKRSVIVTIAGPAGVNAFWLGAATVPTDVLMAVGVWILYAAIGIGMVVAVVMGIRAGGATRFRWHNRAAMLPWRKAHPMPSYDDHRRCRDASTIARI